MMYWGFFVGFGPDSAADQSGGVNAVRSSGPSRSQAQTPDTPSSIGRPVQSASAGEQGSKAKFDRITYQREYMRKWRAKNKT